LKRRKNKNMLSFIRGKIKNKGDNFVILERRDLGYKIFVNEKQLAEIQDGQGIEFYIYENIREDADELFGFSGFEELRLFEKLIGVNGVGPKTALNIFALYSVEQILSAISNQQADVLAQVSGLGQKTAERIVLELKNKIAHLDSQSGLQPVDVNNDALEALVNLGYNKMQAQQALNQISNEIDDVAEQVKEALKILGH